MEQGRLLRLITSKSAGSTPASATKYHLDSSCNDESKNTFAGVAQLAEHLSCKQNVTGSIPVISLKPAIDFSYGEIYCLLIQENEHVAFLLVPFIEISLLHHQHSALRY